MIYVCYKWRNKITGNVFISLDFRNIFSEVNYEKWKRQVKARHENKNFAFLGEVSHNVFLNWQQKQFVR